ncbi:DNA-binding SARP family transcriptional activator [Kitasatospora gansuensis]|uniref:DNA-binding SARP family transcriptional activator n=1 Tax=Kitasatospora gansuensis TaxID=258050 RepID=A0A7W7SCU9_9ACTN|nr:AfsR/SARP family transcriptional regulator [Kitasatospora gansuensis]MBB4947036.1 DNA-binding SARP family transcriptional activator [Kitasatospora gansuensis]
MTVISPPSPRGALLGSVGAEPAGARLGLLGPLQLHCGGTEIALPAAKHRALLALLAINANRPVQVDRIIAELWQADEPESARKTLQGYVWRLRGLLGKRAVRTTGSGYELLAEAGSVDATRFETLAEAGRAALRTGDAGEAVRLLRGALELWRGPALADVPLGPGVFAYVSRLEEARLMAVEGLIDAELALGRHAEVVPALRELVAEHPLRERLRAQLMLALLRGGRQAEALAAYGDLRERLIEDQGLDPGRAVTELHRRILAGDAALHLA